MLGCWPLACFWRGGHRRPTPRSSSRSCPARGYFAFLVGPCTRGCFNVRAVFARHVGWNLPRGRTSRSGRGGSDSDTESDDAGGAVVGENSVRPAMASVYIDCDVLLRHALLLGRKRVDCTEPLSIVAGAEGLPNSPQPFFQARREAAQQRVWLVVNLQHPKSKVCEKLNSDVWSQRPFCEDVFANKALLWQRDVHHFQAEQFIVYYFSGQTPSAEECPLVIILDPRTGRALRRWSGGSSELPLDPEQALQRMNTFFQMHTLEGFSPPESPQHSPKTSPEMTPAEDPPEICLEDFEEVDVTESVLGEEVAQTDDGASSICGPFWDIVEITSSGSASPAAPFCTKIDAEQPMSAMTTLATATSEEAAIDASPRYPPQGVDCSKEEPSMRSHGMYS